MALVRALVSAPVQTLVSLIVQALVASDHGLRHNLRVQLFHVCASNTCYEEPVCICQPKRGSPALLVIAESYRASTR